MKRYYFKKRLDFYALGPTKPFPSMEKAKEHIKELYDLKTFRGWEIWECDERF